MQTQPVEKPLWSVLSGDCVGLVPPGEGPPRGAVSAEHQRVDGTGPARAPDALPSRARLSPGSWGRGLEGSGARLGLPRGRRVPVTSTEEPQAPDCPGSARPDQALRPPSTWIAGHGGWGKAAVIPGTWHLSPSGKQNKTSLHES